MTYRIKALTALILVALVIWAVTVYAVYAQDAATVTTKPLPEILVSIIIENILPVIGALLATVLTAVLAKVYAFVGVQDEAVKLDIEAKLRKALHDAAANGIEFGLSKLGIPYAKNLTEANAVLDFAAGYVYDKNPGTVKALRLSTLDVNDIVRTKMAGAVALAPADNAESPAKSD